jgi:probable F420-dependent oxidoreductase
VTQTKFGIGLPNVAATELPPPQVIGDMAARADDLGFHSAWVIERLLHKNVPTLDPLATLTFAAARTRKVKLGTSILLLPLRNPVSLAKSIATLDYLSSGRLILGMALGGSKVEYAATGKPIEKRVGLFLDALRVMESLWSGEEQTQPVRGWNLTGARMIPRPVQSPRPPVLFGGGAEGVLKRAGRLADGWIAGGTGSPEEVGATIEKVKAYASARKRDASKLDFAKILYFNVNRDKEKSKAALKHYLGSYYAFPFDVEKFCPMGSPSECASFVKRYLDAGVTIPIMIAVEPSVAQVEAVGNEVIPSLQRS